MTSRSARKPQTLSFVFLFVGTITLFSSLTSRAQVGKTAAVSDQSLLGIGRGAKRSGALPMDSEPLQFLPPQIYPGGGLWAGVADVNGDGKPDVVSIPDQLQVLLGNGDGTFTTGYSADVGVAIYGGAIADVNGDGKPDILVPGCGPGPICDATDGFVGVLLGNGDGTFQPQVYYDSGGMQPSSVAVADVNGDGKPDLVVANSDPCGPCVNGISVLLGNGDGTFQPPVVYDVRTPWSAVFADVNGDGKPDIVTSGSSAGIGILLGNGDGTFQPPVYYRPVTQGGIAILAVADLNGDGELDIAVADGGLVAVMLNNGDGTFQPPANYGEVGLNATSVAVADMNGDGIPDLLVTDGGNAAVDVFLGNGDGTFQPASIFHTAWNNPFGVAAADLNGNGKLDIVVTMNNGPAEVLLNATAGSKPTTTTLVSNSDPSNYEQPVQFTATVTAASGKPKGTLVFLDSEASTAGAVFVLGYAKLSNGSASFSTSSLTPGPHFFAAAFEGSGAFQPSASAQLNQVVNQVSSTTSVGSSSDPARIDTPVTYTATVTNKYGLGIGGSMAFQDGGTQIADVLVSNGRASYTTHYSRIGVHSITAVYSGDQNNSRSTSPALTQDIDGASKTAVATSESPSLPGQPVTFAATIASMYGTIPNGELVTFYNDLTPIGTAPTASGVATFTTSSLTATTHLIKATYAGDATFIPSTGHVTQVVDKYTTTTNLASSLNPSASGQKVTFTATVTSTGSNAPTGDVVFKDGATTIGTAKLNGGVTTLTKSNLAAGSHSITAGYGGDAVSAKSTSAVLTQVVD